MKKVSLIVLTLAVLISSCYQPVCSFSVVYVDDSYPDVNEDIDGDAYFTSIAAAVAAVGAGGTVNVAAGVYTGQITIAKSKVTLRSIEGAAVTLIDYTGVWCGYWSTGVGGVDIPYGVHGVTVEGFTIIGGSPASDALISIGGNDNTIRNNVVIGDPFSGGQDIGIHVGDVAETAEQLPSTNIIVNNNVYNHAGSGIFVGNWAGVANTISGNTVHHNVIGGIPGLNGNGIEIDRALGVTVMNNTVYNNEAAGVKVVRTAPYAVIEISQNTIIDNETGVASEAWRPGASTTAEVFITCNNIVGNTDGVVNTETAVIEAGYNWWGDARGPYHPALNPQGAGDTVSDNVTFTPWGLVPNPCASQSSYQGNPLGKKICPLADYNLKKAEAFLDTVQELLEKVQDLDADTSHVEELLDKAEELLEKARIYCRQSQNCIAGNNLAIEAQNLLEEAQELLTSMLE